MEENDWSFYLTTDGSPERYAVFSVKFEKLEPVMSWGSLNDHPIRYFNDPDEAQKRADSWNLFAASFVANVVKKRDPLFFVVNGRGERYVPPLWQTNSLSAIRLSPVLPYSERLIIASAKIMKSR